MHDFPTFNHALKDEKFTFYDKFNFNCNNNFFAGTYRQSCTGKSSGFILLMQH